MCEDSSGIYELDWVDTQACLELGIETVLLKVLINMDVTFVITELYIWKFKCATAYNLCRLGFVEPCGTSSLLT